MGKLTLHRETMMTLEATHLDGVHGGVTPAVFTASVRFCAPAAEAIRQSAIRSCLTCRCR
ncbi:MAG: hypothetical protein KIT31_42695 [Deltaproteobacteria bacterium]|nr:hypothetical protein [Deltaproteobacteria bacterium]